EVPSQRVPQPAVERVRLRLAGRPAAGTPAPVSPGSLHGLHGDEHVPARRRHPGRRAQQRAGHRYRRDRPPPRHARSRPLTHWPPAPTVWPTPDEAVGVRPAHAPATAPPEAGLPDLVLAGETGHRPVTVLRRSRRMTSRQRPWWRPMRWRVPTTRKPAFSCRRRL